MSKIVDEKTVHATIKKYMLDQNRPYNALSVFLNLHNTIAKPCVFNPSFRSLVLHFAVNSFR
jgi:hypothetical protein